MSEVYQCLKDVFGFDSLRSGQEEVIDNLLRGNSTLAVFPTGSGKSLCYQLPALLLDGLTLVVSPLIALMKDQVESLIAKGISARKLDSTLSFEEAMEVFNLMNSGQLKVLFVAPERFANPTFITRLKRIKIALLAVDEAHCISEWGHAFRPDYLKIAKGADELGINLRLALTATATPKVSEDICKSFQISEHVQTGFKRPNLSLHIIPVTDDQRDQELLGMVQAHPGESTIIYVTQQITTERVTTFLNKVGGLKARSYHAGMGADMRSDIQEEFMEGRCDIIVATIAFGMGIDKADIRHVYHYNLPKSFENYVQETGRAGRDGKPSRCVMLACQDDLGILENFVFGKRPSFSAIESLVNNCLRSEGEVALDRYNLSVAYDMKTEVIQTILVWLELRGYVRSLGWRHGKYDVTISKSMDQLLAGHTTERQQFLQRLFQAAKRNSRNASRYIFEVTSVAETLGESEQKIAKSLQWLESHGDLSLKPSQYLMLYQATSDGLNRSVQEVSREVDNDFTQREAQELDRLQSIIDLTESRDCLEQTVLAYFGEQSPPCGKCSACLGDSGGALHPRDNPELGEGQLNVISEVARENHPSLRSSRQMARFLCGITSPATTRARLTTKHAHFGALKDYLFSEVLMNCEVVMGN